MRDEIVSHFENHVMIRASQHGFWKGRSCLRNILVYLNNITSYIDEGLPVDCIYLDVSRSKIMTHKHKYMRYVCYLLHGYHLYFQFSVLYFFITMYYSHTLYSNFIG